MGTLGLALRTPPFANVPWGSVVGSIISSRALASMKAALAPLKAALAPVKTALAPMKMAPASMTAAPASMKAAWSILHMPSCMVAMSAVQSHGFAMHLVGGGVCVCVCVCVCEQAESS